jgi:nucleotide-binding universal stress UspA family protein
MRTLIIVTDSPYLEGVIRISKQILAQSSQESTIMSVIPRYDHEKFQQAEQILYQSSNRIGVNSLKKKVRVSSLVKAVCRETAEMDYDLLILDGLPSPNPDSMCSRTAITQIVERIPCSTLLVGGMLPRIQRILLCDSGSTTAQYLRDFTVRLASLLDDQEQVTILHVMSQISAGPGIVGADLRSDAEKLIDNRTPEGDLLERDILSLQQAGVFSIPKIRHGLVLEEILEEARSGEYDLVIIGAHLQAGWQKILLDNLARKIVEQIDRSILIVKPEPGP